MTEVVILANRKAIKKDFFDPGLPLEYHAHGFVKGFWKNNVFYVALFKSGDINYYSCYCKRSEYYKVVRNYDNKKLDRPKGILDPHKFKEELFSNNYVKPDTSGNTKAIIQRRKILTSPDQLCIYTISFNHNIEEYNITESIVDLNETEEPSPNCSILTGDASAIYESAVNRDPSYPEWDMNVISDIVEIISSMDDDVKVVLQAHGSLPVYNAELDAWVSSTNNGFYSLLDNEALITYRDFLVQYKAWYLSIKSELDNLEPTDKKRLYSIIGHMSSQALESLDVPKKIAVLDVFCTDSILGYHLSPGEFSEEHIVLKVIKSVTALQANDFLSQLAQNGEYSKDKTLFELLYRKIGDEGLFGLGIKNRFALINRLYLLWYISDFNPYVKYDLSINNSNTDELYNLLKDKIVMLPYDSKKSWGFYVDNMDFHFSDNKIESKFDYGNWLTSPILAIVDLFLDSNKYDYYQAVTFKNTNENEYAVQIPGIAIEDKIPGLNDNTLAEGVNLPLFYLKYMDDTGDKEDTWTGFGFALDIILTFTGVGNLPKLRHLRHITKLGRIAIGKSVPAAEKILAKEALRGIVGAVELTSSVASLILTHYTNGCQAYINNVNQNYNESNADVEIPTNPDHSWCRKLDRWLMAVQLVSGGVDLVTQRVLTKTSKELVENVDDIPVDFPQSGLNIIASYANADTAFFAAFKLSRRNRIVNGVRIRVDEAKYKLKLNDTEIDEIIEHGTNKSLKRVDIELFIFNSASIKKPLTKNEVLTRMTNLMDEVRPRHYPYGFIGDSTTALSNYNLFKNKIINILEQKGLPTTNIKIGGSALQTPNAKDLDVYSGIASKKQLDKLVNDIESHANYLINNDLVSGKARKDVKAIVKDLRIKYNENNVIWTQHIIDINSNTGKTLQRELKELPEWDNWINGIEVNLKYIDEETQLYLNF